MNDELHGHERLVAELRAAELDAPPRLRARVLSQERRRSAGRLAALVAALVVVGAGIGGAVSHSTGSATTPAVGAAMSTDTSRPAPKATETHPYATSPPITRHHRRGWTTTEGALAGAGGGLALGGLGVALIRLRRRSIR